MHSFNLLFLVFALLVVVLLSAAAFAADEISIRVLFGIFALCAFFLACLFYAYYGRK